MKKKYAKVREAIITEVVNELKGMRLNGKSPPVINDIELWEHGWRDAVERAICRVSELKTV